MTNFDAQSLTIELEIREMSLTRQLVMCENSEKLPLMLEYNECERLIRTLVQDYPGIERQLSGHYLSVICKNQEYEVHINENL